MIKKLFLAFCFFASFQLSANISEIDVSKLSTTPIVKTITVDDGFDPKFKSYKFRESGPEVTLEIRHNKINIAWYRFPESEWQQQNESNYILVNEILENLVGKSDVVSTLKDGNVIKNKKINGWTLNGSVVGGMYLISLSQN